MPVIDQEGRVFALVNIIDLLAVMMLFAIVVATSALVLPQATAVLLMVVVGVVSLVGLVGASKWYHDVSWETVREAVRSLQPSRPGRPSLRGVWRWFTTEPEPDVIVIDLRETLTVGPIIVVLDHIFAPIARLYRGSVVESIAIGVGTRIRRVGDRTGVSALLTRVFAPPSPPEATNEEDPD